MLSDGDVRVGGRDGDLMSDLGGEGGKEVEGGKERQKKGRKGQI